MWVRLKGCYGVEISSLRAIRRAKRTAGGSIGGKQSESGACLPCARAGVSGASLWGRKRWHGQARAGTQIYLRGGLAVAVFPHPS